MDYKADYSQVPTSIELRQVNSLIQRRYVVAFLGFLCAVVMHSQRLNISIAMVAMVNTSSAPTSLQIPSDNSTNMECPAIIYNTTEISTSSGEFFWDPELQGYILSAGFLGYVLTQIPGGVLTRMFTTKKILILGLIISAICNLLSPIGARQHPYILLILTLIRGMAQGLKQPALSVLMSNWFPRSDRGFLSAFIYCGYPVGAFITCLVSGVLSELSFLDGWPLVFYAFGILGILVSILFLIFFSETPEEDPSISAIELKYIREQQERDVTKSAPSTPWVSMLTSLRVHVLILGLFGTYWMAFYFASVHSIYLATVLNIPIKQNGAMSSGPFVIQAIAGWCACYFSYYMSRRSTTTVEAIRKGCNSISCIIFGLGLIGVYLARCDLLWNEICLYIAGGSVGFTFAGSLITAVDMSPTFCGPLMGFASTMGSFAGFLIPVTVGYLTNDEQTLDQWGKVFLLSIGISLFCGVVFQFWGSAEIQPWDPAFDKVERKEELSRKDEENDKNISVSTSV